MAKVGAAADRTKLRPESKQSKGAFKAKVQPNPQTQATNLMTKGAGTKFVS